MIVFAILLPLLALANHTDVDDTCFYLPRKTCRSKRKEGCKWNAKFKKCAINCKLLHLKDEESCHEYKGCKVQQTNDGIFKKCYGSTPGEFKLEGWETGLGLGTTDMKVTSEVNEVAKERFGIAFRMLQVFFYNPSAELFEECIRDDPDFWGCHYGLIMNQRMPLWVYENVPKAKELMKELDALNLRDLGELEAAYISGARVRFGVGKKLTRQRAFAAVMDGILDEYPDEIEAMVMLALELMDMNGEGVDVEGNITRARELLWKAHEMDPENAGPAHALTHAYDVPGADIPQKMIDLADKMPQIAPGSLNIIHMPTHLYDRLSMWKRSYTTNVKVVESTDAYCVARDWSEKKIHACERGDRFHALVFLHHAVFQLNEPALAMEYLEQMTDYVNAARRDGEEYYHSYYQRMWARQVLETEDCDLKYHAKTGSVDKDGIPDAKETIDSGYWDFLAEAAALMAYTYQKSPACKRTVKSNDAQKIIDLIHPRLDNLMQHRKFIEKMVPVWKEAVVGIMKDDLATLENASKMRSMIEFAPSQPTLSPGIPVWDMYAQAVIKKKDTARYASALDALQKSMERYNKRYHPLKNGVFLAKALGNNDLADEYQKTLDSDEFNL